MSWRLIHADCVEAMRELDESSVDAIVTDPPYGIGFMGKEWDGFRPETLAVKTANHQPIDHKLQAERSASMHAGQYDLSLSGNGRFQAWCTAWAVEALRVLKPGGHLLAFGGTRTYHRLACALEDAGFEIRDCLAWLYGSGFPKSLDVSKAIDKVAGAEREVVGRKALTKLNPYSFEPGHAGSVDVTAPATDDARRWQGYGTALKPAFEPIVLARKPLAERNVAANVLEHGTGALNIDGTRIEGMKPQVTRGPSKFQARHDGRLSDPSEVGRWPANVVLDEEAAAMLDEQSGERGGGFGVRGDGARGEGWRKSEGAWRATYETVGYGDSGGASRFFYTAKADRAERERGVVEYGGIGERADVGVRYTTLAEDGRPNPEVKQVNRGNHHPTVKPIDLMCWLVRLVTPKGGTVLDPFTGSGSTGIAALREGFSFIGIEREAEYVEIARARIIGDAPLLNVGTEVPA